MVLLQPAKSYAQDPEVSCEKCHGDAEFVANIPGTREHSFMVPKSVLVGTSHSDLDCADCHESEAEGYPHVEEVEPVNCVSCHEVEGFEWSGSVHLGDGMATPGCVSCHTAHNVLSSADPASPTNALNVAVLCGSCHTDPEILATYFVGPEQELARTAAEQYHETVHGVAVEQAGLVVSATCNDCHGAHFVLPADSPASTVNRTHITETCGECHDIPADVHRSPMHVDTAGVTDAADLPDCTDCHTAHSIVRSDEPRWFVGLAETCGGCHERVYETYFDTYHGQVTGLGFGLTAKCSDCHTAHQVFPASNPESSVSPLALVETCARCHEAANANFVKYLAHGDMRDRERYPVLFWPWALMTTLLVSVWSFFAIHSILWLTRSLIEATRSKARLEENV